MTRPGGEGAARFDLSPLIAAEGARLRHALDGASSAADPDEVEAAVHAARRAIKSLRALLRALGKPRSDPHRLAIDDALRALASSLSRTRDLHVASATVLRLRKRMDEHGRKGRKALRSRLAALAAQWDDRAAAVERGRVQHRADAPALEVIERMLDELDPAIGAAELAGTMAKAYGKARRALETGLAGSDADVLHRARGAVVLHQLQTKLLVALTGGGKSRLRELGRLREWLGQHHDLAVAEALAGGTPHHAKLGAAMADLVRAEQDKLVERSRPAAADLFRRDPAALRRRLQARLDRALERLHPDGGA
jgi:hypothetical protein